MRKRSEAAVRVAREPSSNGTGEGAATDGKAGSSSKRERQPCPKRGGADPDQYARFVEKARELGCDDDPAAFDRMFERIVPPKRKPKGRASEE